MRGLPRARHALVVDVGAALNLVGALLKYLSLAFLFPIPLAIGYSEPWWPYLAAGALTALGGWGLEVATRGKERVGIREGFLVVSLTWLLGSVAIALSYLLSGEDQLSRPVDALFEAMSGMTTTGSSVVSDVSDARSVAAHVAAVHAVVRRAWGSSSSRSPCCRGSGSAAAS